MGNRAVVTTLMPLSLLFVLTTLSHAQPARDMRRDVVVLQWSKQNGGQFDTVKGKVKNNSANHYACVRLNFSLATSYDMRQAGYPVLDLGVLSVDVRDLQPRSERDFSKALPFATGLGINPISECTGPIVEPTAPTWATTNLNEQKIVLYDNSNFGGLQKSFGIGEYSLDDFNEKASSIKVPPGLVVIVYEHSAQGVGYGRWVDFLEDQANLRNFNLDNQISRLKIVARTNAGSVWIRNHKLQDGQIKEGHYLVVSKGQPRPPANPTPEMGRPIPPPEGLPGFCTIAGKVRASSQYRRYIARTLIVLHLPNGSRSSFSRELSNNGEYKFTNVPEGKYEVRSSGTHYPVFDTLTGSQSLRPYADGTQKITCQRDGTYTVNFEIRLTDG